MYASFLFPVLMRAAPIDDAAVTGKQQAAAGTYYVEMCLRRFRPIACSASTPTWTTPVNGPWLVALAMSSWHPSAVHPPVASTHGHTVGTRL
jgi:hypothetical protein